jgi:hypothetical protein
MISPQGFDGGPRLLVLNGTMLNQAVPLQGSSLIIGRDFNTNVRFDSEYLSGQHARLDLSNGHAYISDLGSQNGTTVNAVRIQSTTELHDGDVIYFADIATRYQANGQGSFAPPNPTRQMGEMNVGDVTADNVHVAGRDVNIFRERRDNFLRDIASSRSKATWLLVLGFFVFVGGFATFMVGLYKAAKQGQSDFDSGSTSLGSGDWLGPEVGGVPIVAIGYGLAFVGVVLGIIGLVMHIVAAARKRNFESEWVAEGRQKGFIQ